jgi:hypothetical protein
MESIFLNFRYSALEIVSVRLCEAERAVQGGTVK